LLKLLPKKVSELFAIRLPGNGSDWYAVGMPDLYLQVLAPSIFQPSKLFLFAALQ
jgi:hypothetical protein